MDKTTEHNNPRRARSLSKNQSITIEASSNSLWAGSWQWFAIGGLAVVTLVLGYIGFWKNAASRPETRTQLDVFYLTLQLFVLESGSAPGRISWELEIARLIGPIVPAWTVILAIAALFRERIQRFRIRRLHDHIVICGLSRLGLGLARDARAAGRSVAAIEIDEGNNLLKGAANAGCHVIIGDVTDAGVLAGARADRAYGVMAVAGEEGVNVAAAVTLYALVLQKPERDTRSPACYVHVTDPGLCSLLQEHRLAGDANRQPELHFFNFYQESARLLLNEHPLDREPIHADDSRAVHLIIVGLGRMGQSLALEAARMGHYANGQKLRIDIIDREAKAKLGAFYGRHAQFSSVCDVQYKEGEVEDRDILEQIRNWAGDEKSLTTVAVCLDGDSRAFSAAFSISAQVASTRTPIWVRLSDETGLASLTGRHIDVEASKTEFQSFGRMSHVCTLDKLFGHERDALARAIHKSFVEARAREGRPADDPSMRPWEILDETLRGSNRQQADHIAVKLRSIGCRTVPIGTAEFEPVVLTDAEIELLARMEHARWNAERFLSGWALGPKDVPRKVSSYLVPWEDLPEDIRKYDRDAVCEIPHLLSMIGCCIERFRL